MAALFLAPLYILINAYVVRWMIRWMGACHRLFQTMAFRASFIGVYIILAVSWAGVALEPSTFSQREASRRPTI